MKILLVLILFCFSHQFLFSQRISCKNLKKGKFLLLDSIQGNTKIKRYKRIQIEEGERSGLKLMLKIKWIDDCNYSLSIVKILKNPKNINIPENIILNVKIVHVTSKSYTEISSSNLSNLALKRIILIKKS
jgi:hypothetical protein